MSGPSVSPIFILGAARTPIGSFLGGLASLRAPELGAIAIRCAVERSGISPEAIEEVFMGSVIQAGVGQAPA
ncbi:MAG TPA: acetyl-CoA C-acetyltransferase, partial [Candidatus Limnocylindria bacterium]